MLLVGVWRWGLSSRDPRFQTCAAALSLRGCAPLQALRPCVACAEFLLSARLPLRFLAPRLQRMTVKALLLPQKEERASLTDTDIVMWSASCC